MPPPLRRAGGCTCPIASPRPLAFALYRWARRSHLPAVGLEHPPKGLLAGYPNDAAAIRLMLRAQGFLAPLDQPTTTPRDRAAGHLYFRAFTPRGRPRGVPDITTWTIGRKTGLSPAGSMLLWAAPVEVVDVGPDLQLGSSALRGPISQDRPDGKQLGAARAPRSDHTAGDGRGGCRSLISTASGHRSHNANGVCD